MNDYLAGGSLKAKGVGPDAGRLALGISSRSAATAAPARHVHANMDHLDRAGAPAPRTSSSPHAHTAHDPSTAEAAGTTLALHGSLDAEAVARIQAVLRQFPSSAELVLDFSKVRDLDWFALATLAASLSDLPHLRVSVTGYCEQHARLLSYLGMGENLHRPRDGEPSPAPWAAT